MTAPKTPGEVLKNLPDGKFQRIEKITQGGTLEARKLATGIMLAWRVTVTGKTHRFNIGLWDSAAPPKSVKPTAKGFSLAAAKTQADVWAGLHADNIKIGGYPGLLAAQHVDKQKAEQAVIDAKRRADAERQAQVKFNLAALLADYCDYLESLGRRSFSDAISIFKNHVFEPWPQLAATPAKDITPDQVADMMRKVIEAGKARTANKLRSYLRAAYEVAKASRSKPSIPLRFKSYGVTSNPAADTYPDEAANKADKNPLLIDDLRSYWKAIKPMPGFVGAALRLHLLTGGQRIEQLCKLLTADVSADMVILYDGKGRPGKAPRPHAVPLIQAAAVAMRECNPQGAFAISTDGGKTHLAATTLSNWAVAAATGINDFQTKRIRSGVETLLASARISTDIRGRLQSHGITGVQARHYDGHTYLDEKRHALETLFNLLEGTTVPGSNVIAFKAA